MKYIKFTGLLLLIMFSFFYTDKVINVISEKDSLMLEIKKVKDLYRVPYIDGIIDNDTIIPGLNGREIDVSKSYKKMREIGSFNKDLIVYNDIKPNVSITNNQDKYIIKGNNNKQMVSIIFVIDDNKYIDKIKKIIISKGIVVNFFITSDYLISNSTELTSFKNIEVYNYGNNGSYTPDNLIFSNNLISRITKNEAIYCLVTNRDRNSINICSNNGLYTILPNIIIKNNPYISIKDKVSSGSIILLDVTNSNISELSLIIDYIKGKGLYISGLSDLLNEKLEY